MEFRYNPLLNWWVMFAASREKRPLMPKDWCPFCPGSGKVPDNYDVYLYPNDFPIMKLEPPDVPDNLTKIDSNDKSLQLKIERLYRTHKSYGKCDVVLYSPDHNGKIYDLSKSHMRKLIDLWSNRFKELSVEDKIKYVYIFENRGEVVGVTMSHPHGQIYGYGFIPKKLELELKSSEEYFASNNSCIFCDMIETEMAIKKRVVYENESFFAFVPFFAEYPYQIFICSKRHIQTLLDFRDKEKEDMGEIIQTIVKMYDSIFDMLFPYMMAFHQAPVDEKEYDYFHFHIEFYPPLRNKQTQKFNASSETGAWVHGNPASPEDKAAEMREIIKNIK